jgi:hypothetical protein
MNDDKAMIALVTYSQVSSRPLIHQIAKSMPTTQIFITANVLNWADFIPVA